MISRKITVLVILIIILFLYFLPEIYKTALVMLGWTPMNTTISSKEYGEITVLRFYPDAIKTGDQVSIIVNSTNKGNILGDFRLRLIILKDDVTLFNSTCDFSLDVSEEDSCIFYYTPTQVDIYQLQAQLQNQTETVLWDIKLKNMTVASQIISPTQPSGQAPSPIRPSIVPTVKSIEIMEYPYEINGTKGDVKVFSVKVKNTGNTPLYYVKLLIEDLPFFTKISPENLNISTNTTQTFLVRLEIAQLAEFKDYSFTLKVVADGVSDSKNVKLHVIYRTIEERVRYEIEELNKQINELWKETLNLQTQGYNVSEAFKILDEAKENLKIAEGYYDTGDYENSEKYLEYVRTKLENIAIIISQFKAKVVVLPAISFQQIYIMIIFVVIVLVLIMIIFLQRKKLAKMQEAAWTKLKEKWKQPTQYKHIYPSYITYKKVEKLKKKEEKPFESNE